MIHILPHTERFIEVFEQLKDAGRLPTNAAIARNIGMKSSNTLTEIRKRRQNIKIEHLQNFCSQYQVNIQDILDDDRDLSPKSNWPQAGILEDQTLIPYFDFDYFDESTEDAGNAKSVPLYYMKIPEFRGCIAFRIHSDSMTPLIPPGGIMFCKKLDDWKDVIEFGQIYLIRLKGDRKLLKHIYKHPDNRLFVLKSANVDLEEFTVSKSKIESIWLIEGWLYKKTQ